MGAAKIPTESGGVPVTEAGDELLTKFLAWFDGPDGKPEAKAKWKSVADEARAEVAHRSKPAEKKPAPAAAAAAAKPAPAAAKPTEKKTEPSTELATRDEKYDAEMLARVSEPDAITERFKALQERFHLIAPAAEIDILPEGFGVSVSMVHVNPDDTRDGPGEVYSVGGGKVGLSKVVLEKVGAAAGISWDPLLTCRLDNRKDPRYCHFRAVGTVRLFDGTPRVLTGEVEIDARDGSDVINEITTKAAEREKDKAYRGKRDGGASQVLELRKFLARHAESKAKLRAIASMGVKRAYTKKELAKPFAVAKLCFTGRTNNPRLAERFALMAAESALAGAASLYGGTRQLSAGSSSVALHDPPPVEASSGDTARELGFDFDAEWSAPDDGAGNDDREDPEPQARQREPGEDDL